MDAIKRGIFTPVFLCIFCKLLKEDHFIVFSEGEMLFESLKMMMMKTLAIYCELSCTSDIPDTYMY